MAGILEAQTRAVGRALAEAGGTRSTRTVSGAGAPESRVRGAYSASSVGGTVITFPASTIPVSVQAGDLFELTSDPLTNVIDFGVGTAQATDEGTYIFLDVAVTSAVTPGMCFRATSGVAAGRYATIIWISDDRLELELSLPGLLDNFIACSWEVVTDLTAKIGVVASRDSATQVTLRAPGLGESFTNQSFQIFSPPETTLDVESALDWPTTDGLIASSGGLFRYMARTDTELQQLRPLLHHARWGTITVLAPADLTDGKGFTIDDGFGRMQRFEFSITDDHRYQAPSPGALPIRCQGFTTADEVRDETIVQIRQSNLLVSAFAEATGVVGLIHKVPGGEGMIDVVDDVTDTDFLTNGPYGLRSALLPLAEVMDASNTFSGWGQYWRGFMLRYAESEDLTELGRLLGVSRPFGLDDDRYRVLIQNVAYSPRGTIYGLILLFTALYGPDGFELFEDLTDGSLQEHHTVFVRRYNHHEVDPNGKAFIAGEDVVVMADANTATLSTNSTELTAIGSIQLADDPNCPSYDPNETFDRGQIPDGRLIATGVGASSIINVVTAASGTPFTPGKLGDYYEVLSGIYAGLRATIIVTGGGTITYMPLAGSPVLYPPGSQIYSQLPSTLGSHDWRIVRPFGNYRLYTPQNDTFMSVPGGAAGGGWATTGTAPTLDGANFWCEFVLAGATDSGFIERTARIDTDSRVELAVTVDLSQATEATASSDERQISIEIHDGTSRWVVGVLSTGANTRRIGFLDTSLTAFNATAAEFFGRTSLVVDTGGATTYFTTIRLVRLPDQSLRVYVSTPDDTTRLAFVVRPGFHSGSSTDRKVRFGSASANHALNYEVRFTRVDWKVTTGTDYGNQRVALTDTTADDGVVAASSVFVAADDDAGTKRLVRLTRSTDAPDRNAAGGTPEGLWEVSVYTSGTVATLRGVQQHGLRCVNGETDRLHADEQTPPFTWPDVLGHKIQILNGPNAASRVIDDCLHPVSGEPLKELYPEIVAASAWELLPRIACHSVVLTTDLASSGYTEPQAWRLLPVFATSAAPNIELERIDAAVRTGTALDLPANMPSGLQTGTLMKVVETYERSAHFEKLREPYLVASGEAGANGATTADGIVVTVPSAIINAAGSAVRPGQTFRILHEAAEGSRLLSVGRAVIESVDLAAGEVTLIAPGLDGSCEEVAWRIEVGPTAAQDNDSSGYNHQGQTMYGAYVFDNFGFDVRSLVQRTMAGGTRVDFDRLYRLIENSLETGLILLE